MPKMGYPKQEHGMSLVVLYDSLKARPHPGGRGRQVAGKGPPEVYGSLGLPTGLKGSCVWLV